MIDISGRQSQETKLIDTLDNLKEAITATYQRKVHERVQGGVAGAGMMGSSFFDTLGLSGIAKNYKEKAEIKEKDRVEKESFVQDFQDNSEAGKVLSTSTARAVAEEMFKQKKQTDSTTSEDEIEANETREKQLEVQQKTSSDITDLYVITDDHFKKTDKYQKDSIKLLEAIAETGAGGGGKGLLGTVADLAGSFGGRGGAGTAGKVGKLAGMAGKLGSVAKVGGGLLAVGTAAYDAYGDYSEADRKVQAGEITKQEGQVEKGKAVGGGIGAAGGALAGAKAGAALGTFLGPAGTVVGGLLGGAAGYIGGKWLGKKAGGGAVSGYQAVTGTGAPEAPAPVAQQMQPVATQSEQIDARKKIVEAKRESFKKPEPVVEQPKTVTPVPASTSQPASPALVSKAAPAPAAVAQAEPMVEKPVTADGETYDNRSALTGFTKEYLQSIVDGKIINAPINSKQAEEYLSKIQPGQAGFKKKMMRGRPVGEITPPTPLPAEPAPSGQAGDLSAKRSELMDAESAASSQATTNNTVVAPKTTNVINNNTTSGEPKSPRNSESTYQKYAERRFYPA